MPKGEFQPRHGERPREDRTREALQALEQGIDSILSSESFAAYLRTLARFHQYSFGNVALIHLQRPGATQVAGYRRWQELGRQVKKGETGIKILVPHKRKIVDEETEEAVPIVTSFGVGTVFDISQTEGQPLPEPPAVQPVDGASDVGRRLFVDLMDSLELDGVSVSREETRPANGFYDPILRHIALGHHIDGDHATKTLTHEAAHHVAGHRLNMERQDVEAVAESTAFGRRIARSSSGIWRRSNR